VQPPVDLEHELVEVDPALREAPQALKKHIRAQGLPASDSSVHVESFRYPICSFDVFAVLFFIEDLVQRFGAGGAASLPEFVFSTNGPWVDHALRTRASDFHRGFGRRVCRGPDHPGGVVGISSFALPGQDAVQAAEVF
jgi:hypothetical protein